MSERIKGVMAAGLTAFNDDLSIDVAGTIAHTRWLLANGCDGVLLFGHADPIGEPVVAHGPFVMTTREEIQQAIRDYQEGRFDAPAAQSG